MQMNDESWHLIKNIPKITNFLGANDVPKSISQKEVDDLLSRVQEQENQNQNTNLFNLGDKVEVLKDSLSGFSGTVESVDYSNETINLSVVIFGKKSSVDLSFKDIKKIES
jgi:transcriptional antiterminator NusG